MTGGGPVSPDMTVAHSTCDGGRPYRPLLAAAEMGYILPMAVADLDLDAFNLWLCKGCGYALHIPMLPAHRAETWQEWCVCPTCNVDMVKVPREPE